MICHKCDRDLKGAIAILGVDAARFHEALHQQQESVEMRALVEKEVIENYKLGLDEIVSHRWDMSLANDLVTGSITIEEVAGRLSNKALLDALSGQHCQRDR